jgi:uncharacterized Zn finger protein
MTEATALPMKSKCPQCHQGNLETRFMVQDGLPDLRCTNAECGKVFRAIEKDCKNNRYRIYLIDQYGLTSGKSVEIEI